MNIYDQIHANTPKEELSKSFIAACHVGDLNAVISLLSNPDFEKYVDVHFDNDVAFKWTIYNKRVEVMQYLILDYKIEKTKKMEDFLSTHNSQSEIILEARKMFEIQELNNSLENELKHNNQSNKKIKL